MKRIAFTIMYNAAHHLRHCDFALKMISMFDHWIIAEGFAGNKGSTSWCNELNCPIRSIDDTINLIGDYADKQSECVRLVSPRKWESKDEMVNACIDIARDIIDGQDCFLWQVDADEHWTDDQLSRSEKSIIASCADTGMFLCNYFIGENLIVRGQWGEGLMTPYRRLWHWKGQRFASHEPPILSGGNGKEMLLQERFDHYAYFFEHDVKFKAMYYSGHEHVYRNWKKIQSGSVKFPAPISTLFSGKMFSSTKSRIYQIKNHEKEAI
ncbi:MAG: hypothetical protein DWQ44_08965 [Bacteroidetes bacterium]|nr:MAG: hypothetical protein DWQ33_02810 [Bacteroidota bacterium]REK06420.1 MAG: hypothetical protein DWQ39_02755 [Bacteroidota bacterium]REK33186.1 MAG: hypothetical protein DWQ44_08965 [Bacteroidota bacterium]REK47022.1 MAG: hypothetical protein DWQ48_13295 [Bacteroidota bacterium]